MNEKRKNTEIISYENNIKICQRKLPFPVIQLYSEFLEFLNFTGAGTFDKDMLTFVMLI